MSTPSQYPADDRVEAFRHFIQVNSLEALPSELLPLMKIDGGIAFLSEDGDWRWFHVIDAETCPPELKPMLSPETLFSYNDRSYFIFPY